MVRFAEVFPDPKILQALTAKLSWTHLVCKGVHANCNNDPPGYLLNRFLPGLTLQFSYAAVSRLF
jgi:hypothetical protein